MAVSGLERFDYATVRFRLRLRETHHPSPIKLTSIDVAGSGTADASDTMSHPMAVSAGVDVVCPTAAASVANCAKSRVLDERKSPSGSVQKPVAVEDVNPNASRKLTL